MINDITSWPRMTSVLTHTFMAGKSDECRHNFGDVTFSEFVVGGIGHQHREGLDELCECGRVGLRSEGKEKTTM